MTGLINLFFLEYHLIFNGEIYNFRELKEKYLRDFTSKQNQTPKFYFICSSNSEKILKKLNGMWLLQFMTKINRNFICLGKFMKTLHYITENNEFYFSSEIKNIACLINKKLQINLNQIRRFLVYGYKTINKYSDHFYKNLFRLEPSSSIEIDENLNLNKNNYYKVKVTENNFSKKENIERTRDSLIESVKSRMVADVPLAFCLSGGVDSNSIVGIAKKVLNKNVKSYSILDDDERYNEKNNIMKILDHLEIEHQNIYLKDNLISKPI